jgi:RNA polymerase sigma-70 factor, ECF subfamily
VVKRVAEESNQASQDDLFDQAVAEFGAALDRLVRAYEADSDKRRDLLQEIHMALWQSFETYESRCSLRTWVYRVAHNTAASHILRQRRLRSAVLMSLEEIESTPDPSDHARTADDRLALERLLGLVQRLKPPDRQLMLLYLEDMDAASIAEIAGVSPANVRTKIYRIKDILARRFHGGRHDT